MKFFAPAQIGLGLLCLGLVACSAEQATPADATAPDVADSEAVETPETSETEAPAAPPDTDIYLFDLSWADGVPVLGEQIGVIGSPGYDNQPFFTEDGGVLYTSAGETGNTDIWRYDLASGTSIQLTDTPGASEYSPKTPPGEGALSYLYQPPGGYAGNAYLADTGNANPRAAHDLAPVGYYAFSEDMRYVATFYLGEDTSGETPFTLQLIDRSTTPETVTQLAENPGRTLIRTPGAPVIWVSIGDEDGNHRVHALDLVRGRLQPGIELPAGSEDFTAFTSTGGLVGFLAIDGDQLVYREPVIAYWIAVSGLDLQGMTRLAISPDRSVLAIVAEEER